MVGIVVTVPMPMSDGGVRVLVLVALVMPEPHGQGHQEARGQLSQEHWFPERDPCEPESPGRCRGEQQLRARGT